MSRRKKQSKTNDSPPRSLLTRRAMLSLGLGTLGASIAYFTVGRYANDNPSAPVSLCTSLDTLIYDRRVCIQKIEHTPGTGAPLILIPMSHDDLSGRTDKDTDTILNNCDDILRLLHVGYGVRNILFESMDAIAARTYNREHKIDGLQPRNHATEFVEKTLNAYRWTLIPGANESNPPPRIKAAHDCVKNLESILAQAKKSGWFASPATLKPNQNELLGQLQKVSDEYDLAMDPIIANDPDGSKEYKLTVGDRDDFYLDNAIASDASVAILIGAAHTYDLTKKMKERGRRFYVVVPTGLPWPQNDEPEKLHADLLKAARPPQSCMIRTDSGDEARIQMNYRNAGK